MMGGSIERNGWTYICNEPFLARKVGDALLTHVFDVFQILNVSHLSLDKLKNDTIQGKWSTPALDPDRG